MIEWARSFRKALGTQSDTASRTGTALARSAVLVGANTLPTSLDGTGIQDNTGVTTFPLRLITTLTNPGTTLTSAIDITGAGHCLWLTVNKPAVSTNSVAVNVELTVDGNVLLNDVSVTITSTSSSTGARLVGMSSSASGTYYIPLFIPFQTQFKVRCRFSGAPGASNNDIAVGHFEVYR